MQPTSYEIIRYTGETKTIDTPAALPFKAGPLMSLPEAPVIAGGAVRANGTTAQHGRLSRALPAGTWVPRWTTPVRSLAPHRAVLAADDRLVLDAEFWETFDLAGQTGVLGRAGPTAAVVDPADRTVLTPNAKGSIEAWSLETGRRVFDVQPMLGAFMQYPLVARFGRYVLAGGPEVRRSPDGGRQPDRSILERIDLGEPLETDDDGLVLSSTRVAALLFPTATLAVAGDASVVVAAAPDRLFFLTPELQVTASYADFLQPLALSLDESGRAYVVGRTPKGLALWIVSPDGRRVVTPLTAGAEPGEAPLVARDHRVFLVTRDRLAAFDSSGTAVWEHRATGTIGGASLSADDTLLVAESGRLLAFSKEGQGRVLYEAPGLEPTTAPAIDGLGQLVVATTSGLLALETTAAREARLAAEQARD